MTSRLQAVLEISVMLISTIKLQLQSNRFENHLATMASLGKIPMFAGEDYTYWKVRMRAFLQSMGAEVWEITRNQAYEVLAVRTTHLFRCPSTRLTPRLSMPYSLAFLVRSSHASRVFRKPTKFGRALRTTTREHLR